MNLIEAMSDITVKPTWRGFSRNTNFRNEEVTGRHNQVAKTDPETVGVQNRKLQTSVVHKPGNAVVINFKKN